MNVRAHGGLVYVSIFATIMCGVAHLPWWGAVVGMCALMLLSIQGRQSAIARGEPGVLIGSEGTHLLAASLNAATIAAVAYGFGRLSALAWGL